MRTAYIAYDGREFDNENDCLHYEEKCKKKALENYYGIPHVHFTYNNILIGASDEIGYDIIHVRNEEDVKTINEVLSIRESYSNAHFRFDNSYIGKNIPLFINFCNELFYDLNEPTFEAIKTRIEDTLNSIVDQLKAFEN